MAPTAGERLGPGVCPVTKHGTGPSYSTIADGPSSTERKIPIYRHRWESRNAFENHAGAFGEWAPRSVLQLEPISWPVPPLLIYRMMIRRMMMMMSSAPPPIYMIESFPGGPPPVVQPKSTVARWASTGQLPMHRPMPDPMMHECTSSFHRNDLWKGSSLLGSMSV